MRKDLGYEFCRTVSEKNPFVAGPLKRTDCSLVSDGAAAIVLTDVDTALGMDKAVAFRAAAHSSDFLPMSKRDIPKFEGCTSAWQKAFAQSGLTLDDLDPIGRTPGRGSMCPSVSEPVVHRHLKKKM